MKRYVERIRPGRTIDANSAVLLPFTPDGAPDYAEFEQHLRRTSKAGIVPAVNMDTGFGPQLTPAQRVGVAPRPAPLPLRQSQPSATPAGRRPAGVPPPPRRRRIPAAAPPARSSSWPVSPCC